MRRLLLQWHNEKGSALLMTLLVLMVFSILGMALVTMSFNHTKQVGHQIEQTQATSAAEMGLKAFNIQIEETIDDINHQLPETFNQFLSLLHTEKPSQLSSDLSDLQGHPSYQVSIENVTTAGSKVTWTIKSTGKVQGIEKSITQDRTFIYGQETSSEGSTDGNLSNRTPEYMGLSLPYMEGSVIIDGNWTCKKNDNVFINGAPECIGETHQPIDVSPIKSLFENMPVTLPSGNPLPQAQTINNPNIIEDHFPNNVNITDGLDINHDTTFEKSVYVKGNLNINGKTTFKGDLYVDGQVTLSSDTTIHGNVYINGPLKLNKDVDAMFNGHVKMTQQIDLGKDSHITFMKNTMIYGDLNTNGKVTSMGNLYLGGSLDYRGGDHFEGYVFINHSIARSNDGTGWEDEVTFTRTVYSNGDFDLKSNKSTVYFNQGVVIKGDVTTKTSNHGKIVFGPLKRGVSTPTAKPTLTVTTTHTTYQ
ncbi:polymer-forming cytoskeletal protein [Terrilactibacillus laevilacticus]|uniref:Type 4 fimbrial biogenesis protein PilX N-terminal domain-containing protein n=1 Tax=Terrilactibacillus laevilacticus TaxID=1380157 RepID=A0ABW5PTB3_9BACI|nr:polymer-forming cytoskeletal protein [Terrilactibacillus laevilacticus]